MAFDAGFALSGAWSHVEALPEAPRRPSDETEGLFSAIEAIAAELHSNRSAHAALRRSNELLLSVIEGTTDVISVKDLGGRYLMMNQAGLRRFGKPGAELIGKTDAELFGPEDAARVRRTDREVMSLAETRTFQQRVRIHRRKCTWLTTKGPYRDHDGNIIGTFEVSRDITEEVRAEEERKRLVLELEQAVANRDDFLAVASHELKSPLAALRLQLEHTLRQLRSDPAGSTEASRQKLQGRLEATERQLQRLSRHVGNLMDVTRVTARQMDLHAQPMDLCAVVQEVVSRYGEEAQAAGCTVEFHCDGPVEGSWDALRLEQVLTNLLTNAIKYGAGKPIVLRLRKRGQSAVLEVEDAGLGIPPEMLSKVFDRFERAPGVKQLPGLGLGLWIVRAIVDAHGGRIRVKSVLGQGSTFTVKLPRAPGAVRSI